MQKYNDSKNLEDYEILGYVQDENDVKVSIWNPQNAYVRITVVSDIPDSVENTPHHNQVRVYVDDIPDIEDNVNDSEYIRESKIMGFMKEHLLAVQPFVKTDKEGRIFHIGQNVKLLDKPRDFNQDEQLCPIPTFNSQKLSHVDNIYQFAQYLKQRTTLGTIRNPWSNVPDDVPFGVIWRGKDKSYLFFEIGQQSYGDRGLSFKMDSLRYIPLNNDWVDQQYRSEDLTYIRKEFIGNHQDEYQEFNPDMLTDYSVDTPSPDVDNDSPDTTGDHEDSEQVASTDDVPRDFVLSNFLKTVDAPQYSLVLKLPDLINFHNSIKSNMLTLLTGLSGTGKSQIATAYADALGIKNSKQFNMVSVRPFWQDDADVLGFVNTLNNTYNPGDSGVVDTLIHAQQHPDQMHLIVFDEMNLARVEYYFSQFLSVLEKAPQDRYIQLYNASLEPRLYNSHFYPHSIKIPDNVRFIGTMNVDETTYQISDKVLDRANVITLQQPSFLSSREEPDDESTVDEWEYQHRDIPVSYSRYQATVYDDETRLSERELRFLDSLNQRIQENLPNVGISWRTVKNLQRFLSNVSHYEYKPFGRQDALDYQITQRVLPKLRGTEAMMVNLLDLGDDDKKKQGISQILDQYSDLSDFSRTRAALRKKSQEIQVMGFAN